MQIHNDRAVAHDILVRLNRHNSSLAILTFMGTNTEIYLQSAADADELIKAAVAAKDLLLAAPLAPCPDPAQHDPHDRCPGVAAPALSKGDVLKADSGAEYVLGDPIGAEAGPGSACDAEHPSYGPDGQCRCIVCARCGHHTGNAHQGHYWGYCVVTGTTREFHFCCPGDCELEAGAEPDPAPRPAPQCLTCGATEDLSAVHVRAREGIAARTEWYCHDTTTCHRRRHPEAASLVAQHGTAGAV